MKPIKWSNLETAPPLCRHVLDEGIAPVAKAIADLAGNADEFARSMRLAYARLYASDAQCIHTQQDTDDDRDPRLVLRSNWDGGVPETVMSEADLVTAVALLENVLDDGVPHRTPAGTIAQIEQLAARSKQKS